MGEPANINRSLNTVRTELEYLRDSGVLAPAQFQSITAQLPGQGGQKSQYVDPHYGGQYQPQMIAQQAQDPNNPAHPQHPKHHEWAKNLGSKFGNAALWGAGATAGSDLVNSVFR